MAVDSLNFLLLLLMVFSVHLKSREDQHAEIRWEFVCKLMARSLYAGLITVDKWGIKDHPGKHQPLISYETWLRVQEVLTGRSSAPARKDLNADFPARGFVLCADCKKPLTACWSKGRSGKRHPYYLCAQKNCVSRRKSIRRDDLEQAVVAELKKLRPKRSVLTIARQMFEDAWEQMNNERGSTAHRLRSEAERLQVKIDRIVDRIADTESAGASKALERKLEELERDQRLIEEKAQNAVAPRYTYAESFKRAMNFLSNPCKLWDTGVLEVRQAVLRMVFAEPISYDRKEGVRTAKSTLPFKALGDFCIPNFGMVEPRGVEPLTSCMPCKRSPN